MTIGTQTGYLYAVFGVCTNLCLLFDNRGILLWAKFNIFYKYKNENKDDQILYQLGCACFHAYHKHFWEIEVNSYNNFYVLFISSQEICT